VSFSINTNVASLQAQNYLRVNSNFQSTTINRVTSGLRIVNSGDDAAGLAVANGYRSDEAVLTQGVQNANQGLSQLQIADGGLSNISQLLDRARTLATESASGTFTGDRSVLNNEYQSVLGEIDRQAQAIGLNTGGTFAKNLSVFIGGGKGTDSAAVITNGSVSVDLSKSTVDTQSLGLQGFRAGNGITSSTDSDTNYYDLSSSSVTSVANIISDNGNATSTSFAISGPGFSGGAGGAVTVDVNLQGVSDTTSLVAAINAGIQSAELQNTPQAAAFKAANITAQIHTGTDGHQQLQFVSADTAFEVGPADATANAFMGDFSTGTLGEDDATAGTGNAAGGAFLAGGTQQVAVDFTTMASSTAGSQDVQTLTFSALDSTGTPVKTQVTLDAGSTADLTAAGAASQINAALQATDNPALQSIVAEAAPSGSITFMSNSNAKFNVTVGTDMGGSGQATVEARGFDNTNPIVQSDVVGVGATSDISTQSGAESAVTALAASVSSLGDAQAAVGRGENQFNYAINLAQSQLTNFTTAESSIRDADLASEAANLTKAQILMQAGVAALAQANSAPQQILALLKQ
jgi:flagellin